MPGLEPLRRIAGLHYSGEAVSCFQKPSSFLPFLSRAVFLPLRCSSVSFHVKLCIGEGGKGWTYAFALCKRDIDYLRVTFLQFDAFVISLIVRGVVGKSE